MTNPYACHGCGQEATWNENNVVRECSHCDLREFAFGASGCKYQWDTYEKDLHYIVTWFTDTSTITVYDNSLHSYGVEFNHLLPLDTRLEQVKLYLTFS